MPDTIPSDIGAKGEGEEPLESTHNSRRNPLENTEIPTKTTTQQTQNHRLEILHCKEPNTTIFPNH
jgi:hypothetical protein